MHDRDKQKDIRKQSVPLSHSGSRATSSTGLQPLTSVQHVSPHILDTFKSNSISDRGFQSLPSPKAAFSSFLKQKILHHTFPPLSSHSSTVRFVKSPLSRNDRWRPLSFLAGLTSVYLCPSLSPLPQSESSPSSSSELRLSSEEELESGVLGSEIMPSELSISIDVVDL